MVKIADRYALIEHVHHDFARRHELRIDLLLILAVRADSCQERSRLHPFFADKRLPRRRARHTDVTGSDASLNAPDSLDLYAKLLFHFTGHLFCACCIDVENINELGLTNSRKGLQLDASLRPAAKNGHDPGIASRQKLRCYG